MKKDARSLSQDAQEITRIRAVEAVLKGETHEEVAERFKVTRQAVTIWMAKYRNGGFVKLRKGQRGRRREEKKLKPHECATVVRMIVSGCPDQLKLPFALWTRAAVAELIKQRYSVELSLNTVGRYLKDWGMTPQKPAKRAYEKNPKVVKKWLEEVYPQIETQAKVEEAEIHFGDETGIRSDHQTGTSYGKRGKTPIIFATGKRFSFNMLSTLNKRGKLRFMFYKEKFTGKVFIRFLKRLILSTDKKVFLIVDSHPVHVCKEVKVWTTAHEEEIRLFFLPPYSPELNPDELLNQDVKTNAVGRKRAKRLQELMKNVRSHLMKKQKDPKKVMCFFQHPSVRYAGT